MIRYLPIAVISAVISFTLFRMLYLYTTTKLLRAAIALAAFVLAAPAVLFTSNYLLNIPNEIWFINLRSLPGTEAISGLIGALSGVMFADSKLRPNQLNTPILVFATIITAVMLAAPFAEQLFFRQDYSTLSNEWTNGICRQTSLSTCVPASCATVIKMLGGNVTEKEIASEAGTDKKGTEIWYLMRALRKHGYKIEVYSAKSSKDMPAPCILSIKLGHISHAVVLMSKNSAGPEIGDPLSGQRKHYTWKLFERNYHPAPVYYVIKPLERSK
ncbi:MAG: cysteine peptidase family C39 domain-containing protein [Armatimonadota bacterium]